MAALTTDADKFDALFPEYRSELRDRLRNAVLREIPSTDTSPRMYTIRTGDDARKSVLHAKTSRGEGRTTAVCVLVSSLVVSFPDIVVGMMGVFSMRNSSQRKKLIEKLLCEVGLYQKEFSDRIKTNPSFFWEKPPTGLCVIVYDDIDRIHQDYRTRTLSIAEKYGIATASTWNKAPEGVEEPSIFSLGG